MQKAINTEANTSLRSSIIIWDADSRCFRGYCLSQNTFTKVRTQGLTAKNSKPEESRSKNLKPANGKTPALPCTNELGKISYQDKKKKYFKKKLNWKNSTLTIKDNAIEDEKKRNK